ncbi:MAG: hypothetical protein IM638_10760 [Bacteroidetes bacterium]|nr:hypothetical protein [Bacteroidota bacterium]
MDTQNTNTQGEQKEVTGNAPVAEKTGSENTKSQTTVNERTGETNLRSIIAAVDNSPPAVKDVDESLIYIDMKKNTSFSRPWNWLLKEYRIFWTKCNKIITLRYFDCYVDDIKSGQRLKIDILCNVELIKGSEYKAVMLFYRDTNLDDAFRNQLSSWVKQSASRKENIVSQFFIHESELNKDVCEQAERNGFKIELRLSPFVDEKIDQDYALVKHTVTCQIKNWEIKLQCTLVMSLYDKRKFNMTSIDNLSNWMKEKIEKVVQVVMIDKTIAQVLQGEPSYEIQKKLESEASEIGFRVKQLISIPLLNEIELLNQFTLDTEKIINPQSEEDLEHCTYYTTLDIRVPIRMNITVKGYISSFSGYVEKYLRPGIILLEKMREEIVEEARLYALTISPDQFYLHFNSEYKGSPSVESALSAKIRSLLERKFNVVTPIIHITPLDTELTERFRYLAGENGIFVYKNIAERIHYTIQYAVTGIAKEGWYTFKSKIYHDSSDENMDMGIIVQKRKALLREQADAERHSISLTLTHHFNSLFDIQSKYDNEDPRSVVTLKEITSFFSTAAEKIIDSHGVTIKLVSVARNSIKADEEYKAKVNNQNKLDSPK